MNNNDTHEDLSSLDYISLVLQLTVLETGRDGYHYPAWWGRAAQHSLLNIIRQIDISLSEELHPSFQNNLKPPYTASSLIGYDQEIFQVGNTYKLRFTSIHPQVASLLLDEMSRGQLRPGEIIILDHLRFEITTSCVIEDDWTGNGTWGQLFEMVDSIDLNENDTLNLEFASPVFFRTRGRYEPLPLPELVFDQVSRQAKQWAGLSTNFDVKEYAANQILIDRTKRFRTTLIETRKGAGRRPVFRTGAQGIFSYRFLSRQLETMRAFYKLAYFAHFSGVGKETTIGCGQVRVAGKGG